MESTDTYLIVASQLRKLPKQTLEDSSRIVRSFEFKNENKCNEELKKSQLNDGEPNNEIPRDEKMNDGGETNEEKPSNEERPNDEKLNEEKPNDERPNDERPNDEKLDDEKPNDEKLNDEKPNDDGKRSKGFKTTQGQASATEETRYEDPNIKCNAKKCYDRTKMVKAEGERPEGSKENPIDLTLITTNDPERRGSRKRKVRFTEIEQEDCENYQAGFPHKKRKSPSSGKIKKAQPANIGTEGNESSNKLSQLRGDLSLKKPKQFSRHYSHDKFQITVKNIQNITFDLERQYNVGKFTDHFQNQTTLDELKSIVNNEAFEDPQRLILEEQVYPAETLLLFLRQHEKEDSVLDLIKSCLQAFEELSNSYCSSGED